MHTVKKLIDGQYRYYVVDGQKLLGPYHIDDCDRVVRGSAKSTQALAEVDVPVKPVEAIVRGVVAK